MACYSKYKERQGSGPDDIPSDFWEECGWLGSSWFAGLFHQLMSYTLKIFERVLNSTSIILPSNQCGFVKGVVLLTQSCTDTVRIVMEKFREKRRELHAAFLDMEKLSTRYPMIIWWALRKRVVPEVYIQRIKMIYHGATSHVQIAAGQSKPFHIKTGMHQGSVLSPLLLITVMNAVTESLKRQLPWALLYADYVLLMAGNRKELEEETQRWNA
ncbi:unnamed protein product [Strongylus vulgaris]|uniref:Reverse transcriptase domain-containing protein n=1 Tax=Strongylus vulgaris TaxID=40348 RepID=A0A3P7IC23_STRVU|nr:unnamed protein product [Strongylus vulgaris]